MVITITLEAENEKEFVDRLDQIKNSITTNTIEDHQLMDGSYQVESANIELELV
jgi:hypothetical protein